MTRRRRTTVALAGLAVVGTGLSLLAIDRWRGGGSSGGPTADATGFYRAGAAGAGPRGQVLASEELPAPAGSPRGSRAWRVRYRTLDAAGQPVVASMAIAAPRAGSPAGGRPVAVWVHGALGVAPGCAPSRRGVEMPYVAELLAAGIVVVAPDLTGLGVEGITHPYLHGTTAGRSVLDAARAAGFVEGAEAGNVVAIGGHSAGGHAALWANELAAGADGEGLDVRVVVPVAPIGDLGVAMGHYAMTPGNAAFPVQLVATWPTIEALDAADVLTPAAQDRLSALDDQCLDGLYSQFGGDPARWLDAEALASGDWGRMLGEQSAGGNAGSAPVVVFQGGQDTAVLPVWTDQLVATIRSSGGQVELRSYAAADHGTVIEAARADVVSAVTAAL